MERDLVTILVVDEDVMVRRVLETLLGREGFSVLSTRNLRTAAQTMKAATVDIVVTDLSRNDRSDTEHTAEIRRLFPDVKVVVMSGFFGVNPPPATRYRADACLSKPVRPEILRQTVHTLLTEHRIPVLGVH